MRNRLFEGRKKRILITGGSGLVGYQLYLAMQKIVKYDVLILDKQKPLFEISPDHFLQVDITNYAAVKSALQGINTVIHLAAALEESPIEVIKSCNILGTENIFKASQEAGVERVIFTSSVMVMYGYRFIEPYNSIHKGKFDLVPDVITKISSSDEPLPPESENLAIYATSKLYGESVGKDYADRGLSCLCIRLGWVNVEDSPIVGNDPFYKVPAPNWCSQRDAVTLLMLCVEAKNISYGIYYGVSNYKYRYFSLENAENDLKYIPSDSIEQKLESSLSMRRDP